MLTGKEKGAPARCPLQKHPQFVVPSCVSTVFCKTLSEAELPGLEGCCVRARQGENSVAPGAVLAGQGKGGTPRCSGFGLCNARARHCGNSVAPLIVLTGIERGAQPLARLAFCASILNKLFPNCVSTVLGNPCPRQSSAAWKAVAQERDSAGTVWLH